VKDYYSILEIPRYSDERTIKEAYRRMAKRWHPDANNGDENAQRMMQDLNRAKEVLFNADTREEYKKVLEMQDALSAENIQKLRKKWSESRFQEMPNMPPVKPFARGRFIFLMALISIAAGIAIFRLSEASSTKTETGDPIDNIVRRNTENKIFLSDDKDSIPIPNVAPDRLQQMAATLAMLNEYKGATKYWEKYLENDPHNVEVTTNLMLAYLHRDDYKKAIQTVRTHIDNDTDLISVYATLGEFFHAAERPYDAEDVYKKMIELGSKIPNPNERTKDYLRQAEKRIEKR